MIGSEHEPMAEHEVERLIRAAGEAPELPADDLAAIKEAARREWRATLVPRRARAGSVRRIWLLAAAVLVAIAIGWWWTSRSRAGAPAAAMAERLTGTVELVPPPGSSLPSRMLTTGTTLGPGWRVRTAGAGDAVGRAALRLANGARVRLDRATDLTLLESERLRLTAGAVYVDTGGGRGAGGAVGTVTIETPFGEVRDIGTRFEVRLLDGAAGAERSVRVRVRDGAVAVAALGANRTVEAGGQITVAPDGSLTESSAPMSGADWEWMLEIAPPFDPDGRSVLEALEWISRETGWKVLFAEESLAVEAGRTILSGTPAESRPDRVVHVILQSAGLVGELDGDVLIVREQ